jgi:hypothetical protein
MSARNFFSFPLIAEVFAEFGPIIGFEEPTEDLPQAGIPSIDLGSEHWKSVFERTVDDSQVVLLTLGATSGLLWELDRIVQIGALNKVALVVPIERDAESYKDRWSAFLEQASCVRGLRLPTTVPSEVYYVTFSPSGRPRFWRGDFDSMWKLLDWKVLRRIMDPSYPYTALAPLVHRACTSSAASLAVATSPPER